MHKADRCKVTEGIYGGTHPLCCYSHRFHTRQQCWPDKAKDQGSRGGWGTEYILHMQIAPLFGTQPPKVEPKALSITTHTQMWTERDLTGVSPPSGRRKQTKHWIPVPLWPWPHVSRIQIRLKNLSTASFARSVKPIVVLPTSGNFFSHSHIHISPVYFCVFVLDQARVAVGRREGGRGVTLAWRDHAALTHIGHLGNGERS